MKIRDILGKNEVQYTLCLAETAHVIYATFQPYQAQEPKLHLIKSIILVQLMSKYCSKYVVIHMFMKL